MIVSGHVREYINSLIQDQSPELEALEQWALSHEVPIIRKEAQELLRFILKKEQPENILEIGAAVGYSALFMLENAPLNAHITTIEKVEMRLKEARKNLSGKERITLLEGDALSVLSTLKGPYDLIFLDAAKGQYPAFLPDCLRLLSEKGMLITDNVLLEGSIAESKFMVERRDRTIHMRMRDFLYEITHREDITSVILPVGDGMAITTKNT